MMLKINKKYIVSFIIISLSYIYIDRSYSVYKLEKKYDNIENTFYKYNRDLALIIDDEESLEFPNQDTKYKVESIDCTNDVNATWNKETWSLSIDDMNASSTKCIVSFDSTKENVVSRENMSKEELLKLNDEMTNIKESDVITMLYPVGSIYMSTTDDTVEKVQTKFGGTWVRYATETTLVGYKEGMDKEPNQTGGQTSIKLNTSYLPNIKMNTTLSSTGSGYVITNTTETRTTSTNGNHSHTNPFGAPDDRNYSGVANQMPIGDSTIHTGSYSPATTTAGNHSHTVSDKHISKISNIEAHTHTYTLEYVNEEQNIVDLQNPYTVIYMYKKTA